MSQTLEITPGTKELLAFACENDESGNLAGNLTLRTAIDLCKDLIEAMKKDLNSLKAILGEVPPHFLALVARANQKILERTEAKALGIKKKDSASSTADFDALVMTAFAQTVADFAWPGRGGPGFQGPSIERCGEALAATGQKVFFLKLVQNYIAEIVLYYFQLTGMRQRLELSENTEVLLREEDAGNLAELVLERCAKDVHDPDFAEDLQKTLETTLDMVARTTLEEVAGNE